MTAPKSPPERVHVLHCRDGYTALCSSTPGPNRYEYVLASVAEQRERVLREVESRARILLSNVEDPCDCGECAECELRAALAATTEETKR